MCQKKTYQSAKEARTAFGNLKRYVGHKYTGNINVYFCSEHAGYHFGHTPKENPGPYEVARRAFAKAKQNIEPIVRRRPHKERD